MGNALVTEARKVLVKNGANYNTKSKATVPLIFSDDFSSGDLSRSFNGFNWLVGTETTVSTLNPYSGTHSLMFDFQYLQMAEQRFNLGSLYNELTLQYMLYIPDGTETWGGIVYDHYNSDGGSQNNKFMRLWDTNTESGNLEKLGFSFGDSPSTGISSLYGEWNTGSGMNWQGNDTQEDNFITSSDLGNWIKIKVYVKHATSSNNDGVIRVYKDDVMVMERTTVNNYHASGDHAWMYGYLLGSQAGVLPQAGDHLYMFIDSIAIWNGEV